ncbi:MAG TPA: ABC transporter permease [Gaiellaceae bacterium]|nr:ABC transporter permease [Gaiellaceae bacterium]
MGRFLIRRLLWSVFLFFVATLVTYLIFFVIPGDPAVIAAGSGATATPQFLARIRHELHLDVPIYQQYWLFVWNLVRHGSLGFSYRNGASVRWILGQDAPVTGSLLFGGAVLWLVVSIPVGILSAVRPRSLLDRLTMVFVLIGISAPAVWIGLILAYVFGFRLGWTPIADYCSFFPHPQVGACGGPGRWAYHLILPWLTFMFLFAALYVRLIRANVMEAQTEDYVRTARAKGASTSRVLVRHVLRNSMLPVVTVFGMDLGLAAGLAVFTESVFDLHGLGAELITAAQNQDLPTVVGIVIATTIAVIVFNFLVDLAYAWLDPRILLDA